MNSPVMGPASCHYACSNSNSERKSRGSEYLGEEHGAPNEQKHSKRPPQEPKVIQMGGWKEKDQQTRIEPYLPSASSRFSIS